MNWVRSRARSISEIKRVPGTRNVYSVGDNEPLIRVELDPGRLTAAGLTAADLTGALQAANLVRQADGVLNGNRLSPVQAGQFLASRDDVGGLIVSARDGKPIYLDDVATVTDAPRTAGALRVVRHRSRRCQTRHRTGGSSRRRDARDREEARHQRDRRCHRRHQPRRSAERHHDPGRRRSHGDPQLWRHRQRQGDAS